VTARAATPRAGRLLSDAAHGRVEPGPDVMVHVQGLRKTFGARGKGTIVAVDDVGFQVHRGDLIGLLGPNGAGKTTTIKALCGLIVPDRGELRVAGVDVRRRRQQALRHLAAVLEGNRNLYWRLSVRENLEYFAGNRGVAPARVRHRIDELLERFALGAKRHALVSDLSRGMQQKLALAVAALADTEVVLLDEPTLGLDVETGYEVRALLRELRDRGRTVIVSTHDMPVVQDLCERTVVIAHGRVLVDDRVDHLLRLFASRAYDVQLAAPLGVAQQQALRRRFLSVTIFDDGSRLQVELARGDDLYALIDVLRAGNTPIETIDRRVIDFETVFRRLVRGENGVGDGADAGSNAAAPAPARS
jgi:ABC-2 type transport system ATP-binding protein